jgi:hypothetical protein
VVDYETCRGVEKGIPDFYVTLGVVTIFQQRWTVGSLCFEVAFIPSEGAGIGDDIASSRSFGKAKQVK